MRQLHAERFCDQARGRARRWRHLLQTTPDPLLHAQYGNRSAAWIKAAAAKEKPFLLKIIGPHLPATPAPWYADLVDANPWNITAPRTPNFNELPTILTCFATHAPLSDAVVADIDKLMRQAGQVLMSMDDLVAGLVDAVTRRCDRQHLLPLQLRVVTFSLASTLPQPAQRHY